MGTFLVSEELEDEFRIETQSGFYLYLKRDDDPEKVVKILKTFLEKHGIFASIPWNYHIGGKLTSGKFPNANKIYSELLQLKIDYI